MTASITLLVETLELPWDEAGIGLLALLALVTLPVAWGFVLWDLARRDDIGRWGKAGWACVAVLLVWAGVVLYLLFRPRDATPAARARRQQASDEFVARHTQPPD
jgi:hypothetical protein